ncbi:MAG: YdcF family protein [Eubacteriales bacterium]|nr:YdcF family protein [Eubacteriales bacterium]
MKNTTIKIIIALFLALAAVLLGVILSSGKLAIDIELPPEASGAEVSAEPDGIIRISEARADTENRRFTIDLTSLSSGDANITVKWDKVDSSGFYQAEMNLPIKVVMDSIIVDKLTYNFSGWEYLSVIHVILLFSLAAIFLISYEKDCNSNGIFSYRSVRRLGFGLFFLVIAVIRFISEISSGFGRESGTVALSLLKVFFASQQFIVWTEPLILLFSAAMMISNIVLIKKEGFSFMNMLGILIGVIMSAGVISGTVLYYSRIVFPGYNAVVSVYTALGTYCECLLAATVISGIRAAVHEPSPDKDYVIILGCRIRPDGSLYPLIRGRVDKAVEFVQKQEAETGKAAVFVPSGGKGSDERLAEAEAMANYLLSRGIPENRILIENRSTTTRENMLFSKALTDRSGNDYKAAFSTSNYHVFRSGLLAEKLGWKLEGMGSKTKWYYWPNAYMREFLGLIADSWVGQMITATGIALVSLLISAVV